MSMFKRERDSGFTLIELMIVIAVIGILAIVLIPKVGSIKTEAKVAGIDSNMRVVEAYVQSRITYWNDKKTNVDEIFTEIEDSVLDANDGIVNPLDNTKDALVKGAAGNIDGAIYVDISSDSSEKFDGTITLTGIGKNDIEHSKVEIRP